MSFTSLILAGGRSRRMQRCKALLPFGRHSLLEEVIDRSDEAGADSICVVVGAHSPRGTLLSWAWVRENLRSDLVLAVGRPDATPYESLRAGLMKVDPRFPVLVWPVDAPFASPSLVRAMCARLAEGEDPTRGVVVPAHGKHRGHPVLIGAGWIDTLSGAEFEHGLRSFLDGPAKDHLVRFQTEDARITRSLNTPEDLTELLG